MQKPLFNYGLAALVGCFVAVVAGYLVYAAPGDAVSFGYWINRPMRFGAALWALAGMAAGAATYRLTIR